MNIRDLKPGSYEVVAGGPKTPGRAALNVRDLQPGQYEVVEDAPSAKGQKVYDFPVGPKQAGLIDQVNEETDSGFIKRLNDKYGEPPLALPGAAFNAPAAVEQWLGTSSKYLPAALRRIGFQGAQGLVPDVVNEDGNAGGLSGGGVAAGVQAAAETLPYIGKAATKIVPPVVGFLSGAPKDAVERLMNRPGQVLGMSKGDNALPIAREAQEELLQKNSAESGLIQNARRAFAAGKGDDIVNTQPIIEGNAGFRESFKPTKEGIGAVSAGDLTELSNIERRGLTTTTKQTDPGKAGFGVETALPQKSARDLQRLADYVDSKVKDFDQKKTPGSGDTRYQAYLRGLYGKIKKALHEIDPDGLGAADKRFSEYAQDVSHLGKLENDSQMESFINNFYGPSKGAVRESTEKLLPKSVEKIKDLGASRAFTKQGPSGSDQGVRRILGSGVAGLLGYQAYNNQDPESVGLAAIALAATSPLVMRSLIGKTSLKGKALNAAIMRVSRENPVAVANMLQQFQGTKKPKGLIGQSGLLEDENEQ